MIDQAFIQAARGTSLAPFAEQLLARAEQVWCQGHGDMSRWQAAIDGLPHISAEKIELDQPWVSVSGQPIDGEQQRLIEAALQQFHPWRKGPFRIHGIEIDSEWRSDLKWQRLSPHLSDLDGRLVLDVGCGNGYYAWRMLGAGAGLVLGIDPTLLFVKQFEAIRHFLGKHHAVFLLPLGIECMPSSMALFDTVFSMGVFYHRRAPLDHLQELRDLLRPGGELVLETLVIEGRANEVLVPADRYAKMRNVWFIPSPATLQQWLERCGFKQVRMVDMTATRIDEQRSTAWMRFESLSDYLHPADSTRTQEGYPAPVRAIFLAEK